MDRGNLGYDQASPASRPAFYVSKVRFARRAVRIPEVGPHGRHDRPVDQVQRLYLDRSKEGWQKIQQISFLKVTRRSSVAYLFGLAIREDNPFTIRDGRLSASMMGKEG
jgi:hypothetical protein